MKFKILHEIKGRMRIHIVQQKMGFQEADILQYYLTNEESILSVKVYERTQNVAVCYTGERQKIIEILQNFSFESVVVPDYVGENSGRKVNQQYWDKLVQSVVLRAGSKWLLPAPLRTIVTVIKSGKYIWNGICTLAKGKIEVPVLDGTAITISLLRGDIKTAGSIMFLLGIGEILEEWTHKKSVDDLARSMSLNISKVWLLSGGKEILVDAKQIKQGDNVVIHMGNVIPFDGVVVDGNGAVNQSSLTGESLPVSFKTGSDSPVSESHCLF